MRILGIDPGLNRTGYGVIDSEGGRVSLVAAGVLNVPRGALPERLAAIFSFIKNLVGEHRPDIAACERVYVNVNPESTLLLGQARGAAVCAAAVAGLEVREFSPSEIKQAVTGTGKAGKDQVQGMVTRLLSVGTPLRPDAADALACALCASQSEALVALTKAAKTSIGRARIEARGGARSARAAWTMLAGERGEDVG